MGILITVYLIYLVIFIIFSVLGLYHLWKYGFKGDKTKIAIIIYSVVALALIIVSFIFLGISSLE
jgi:hypothetical protein